MRRFCAVLLMLPGVLVAVATLGAIVWMFVMLPSTRLVCGGAVLAGLSGTLFMRGVSLWTKPRKAKDETPT